MDLLNSLLVYMTLVFSSSVMSAPQPSNIPPANILPTPTAIVATASPTPIPTPTPTPTPTPVLTPSPSPRTDPTLTPSPEYKTLSAGARGEAVKKLQRRLAELGYLTGTADGVFGNQTKRAVERFQYYNGLTVDGVAGPRTQTVLYESHEVVYAPVDVTPTPSPKPTATNVPVQTATQQPSPTQTPAPTLAPTETATPSPTPAPTETITPSPTPIVTSTPSPTTTPSLVPEEATAEPTEEPTEVPIPEYTPVLLGEPQPLEGSYIMVDGSPVPLKDEEGINVPLYSRLEGEVLVPFTTLSRLMGWIRIVDDGNMDQYFVEANGFILEIIYHRNAEDGIVQSLDIQLDGLPVIQPEGQVTVSGDEMFVTPAVLETLMNAQWIMTPEAPVLNIVFMPKGDMIEETNG